MRGDFLAETSRDEENIFCATDPNWTGASMAYVHILRDSDDNAMTVCLDETVTITETTYKISVETYNELQEIPSDEHWYHYMQTTTTQMTTKRQP